MRWRIGLCVQGDGPCIEERTCRLRFKVAVELAVVLNVLAAGLEISKGALEELRGQCVQNVKRTNGAVTPEKAIEFQPGGESVRRVKNYNAIDKEKFSEEVSGWG